MWAFILYFICAEVGGEVDDVKTVRVKEGGFLNLDPGLRDLNGNVQILWTFESGRHSTRVAQMHQGKIYTHYDKRLTGRVQLDRETGILTITAIRTNESGLYKAEIIINTHISERRYKVDVYTPVSVPAVRSSTAVTVHRSTGSSQTSNTNQTRALYPPNKDYAERCGATEALIRLVLSGLVGIATVFFLVEHVRFCSSQRRAAASV